MWCLGSPYSETYREFIAFTTRLYDKVPSFSPPTLSHLPSTLHISLSLFVLPRLCVLLPVLSCSLFHLLTFSSFFSLSPCSVSYPCQIPSALHCTAFFKSLSLTLPHFSCLSPLHILSSPCLPLFFIANSTMATTAF